MCADIYDPGTITAQVRCDWRPTVYVDGDLKDIRESEYWSAQASEDTELLAVKCFNGDNFGGLMVSVGNVLISGSTWKCSKQNVTNWYKLGFDDSLWTNAYVIGNNGEVPGIGVDTRFSEYVQWIWADENANREDTTIYCRGRTGMNLSLICIIRYWGIC